MHEHGQIRLSRTLQKKQGPRQTSLPVMQTLPPIKKSVAAQVKYKNIMMVDLGLAGRNIAYDEFAERNKSPSNIPRAPLGQKYAEKILIRINIVYYGV